MHNVHLGSLSGKKLSALLGLVLFEFVALVPEIPFNSEVMVGL
jgi:hypothetical protein